MKKFFQSVYFNIVLAVLAAVLIIVQEFCLATALPFINLFALGALAGVCFSFGAEILKQIFVKEDGKFNYKDFGIGCAFGVVAAFIVALF